MRARQTESGEFPWQVIFHVIHLLLLRLASCQGTSDQSLRMPAEQHFLSSRFPCFVISQGVCLDTYFFLVLREYYGFFKNICPSYKLDSGERGTPGSRNAKPRGPQKWENDADMSKCLFLFLIIISLPQKGMMDNL